MTYTPEVGHLITFANTYDTKTVYHVGAVVNDRVEVSPIDPASYGQEMVINLGLGVFREMGGSPLVLGDSEMTALEAVYALKILDTLEFLEMVMTMASIFGEEIGQALLPPAEIKRMEKDMDQFTAGVRFLRNARANAKANV